MPRNEPRIEFGRWTSVQRENLRGFLIVPGLLVAALLVARARPAAAYSYAAAGAEPLIEAREKVLADLAEGDFAAAAASLEGVAFELNYLDKYFGSTLKSDFGAALSTGSDTNKKSKKSKKSKNVRKKSEEINTLFYHAFAIEVTRRLEGARQNLSDYQRAKILVIRSKRFFDLLAPALAPADRAPADLALRACLEAIGNPGIFGAGARPPDPTAFEAQEKIVVFALKTLL